MASWFDQFGGVTPLYNPKAGLVGMLQPQPVGAPQVGPSVPGATTQTTPQTAQNFGNLSDPNTWMGLVGNRAQLTAWIKAQAPGLSDGLVNYYADKIAGQPGANPTEQAGSANYWMQKIQSDPTLGGGTGGGMGGGGSLGSILGLNPGFAQYSQLAGGMTPNQILQNDPGFNFALQQGTDAIQRSAAARGTLLTGGTLKDLMGYGVGLGQQAYGDVFNRMLGLGQFGSNIYNSQVANQQNAASLGKPQ